ncbi:MAG: hypothetical protein MUF49_12670 [Oculatellaceae cyanobacterium Prado106]|jgi:hypothetical protein|nr:hypothetical protein [Oculatellaceae cyanobacterium Prado106]
MLIVYLTKLDGNILPNLRGKRGAIAQSKALTGDRNLKVTHKIRYKGGGVGRRAAPSIPTVKDWLPQED